MNVTTCAVDLQVPQQIHSSLPTSLRTSLPEYSPVASRCPWIHSSGGITCWYLTSHVESQKIATRTNSGNSLTVTRYRLRYRRVNFGTLWFWWLGRISRSVSALLTTSCHEFHRSRCIWVSVLSDRPGNSRLSMNTYLQSDADVVERLRTSWLQDLHFCKHMLYNINLPLAVREEISFCDEIIGVDVSPYVFAYYLMFLSHHELHQFDDRDRALRLLVDTVNNPEQRGPYQCLNIAGHCLLLAGLRDRAREIFITSYLATQRKPPFNKYNSAAKYLQKIPWWHCCLSCR